MRDETPERVIVARRAGSLAVVKIRIATVAGPFISGPTGAAAAATSAGRNRCPGRTIADDELGRQLTVPDRSK